MGALRELVRSIFRGSHSDDGAAITPHNTLSSETPISTAAVADARRSVTVWLTEVHVKTCGSAPFRLVTRYPSGVDQFSDELPGIVGDEPGVSCKVGGLSASVMRMVRGPNHIAFQISVPDGIDLADPKGQVVSLVWSGSRPELQNSIVVRLREEKV